MEVLLVILIVGVAAVFVTMPLWRDGSGPDAGEGETTEDPRRAELEARKEAKYREIRDAELDREQGKLSQEDWARLDAQLRREAIEILKELDGVELTASPGEADADRRSTCRARNARFESLDCPAMESILNAVQVLICGILIFLVLLHSGKDAGLSGAFGIGQSGSSFGGGSLVERNLDRWTIFFAVLFAVNTLVLLKI